LPHAMHPHSHVCMGARDEVCLHSGATANTVPLMRREMATMATATATIMTTMTIQRCGR
jgi:hypothetical protein